MTHLQEYDAGDYHVIPVNPSYATVVPKPVSISQPHIQHINAPTSQQQTAPIPHPPSIHWEKLGIGVLIGLGAIALFKYLPAPTATAPTPVIDPVVVRELETQNNMLHQHVRNLESQLLLQSGRPTCSSPEH